MAGACVTPDLREIRKRIPKEVLGSVRGVIQLLQEPRERIEAG